MPDILSLTNEKGLAQLGYKQGMRPREFPRELTKTLIQYSKRRGFKSKGKMYIRGSWIYPALRTTLEEYEIIKFEGRGSDLIEKGIRLPNNAPGNGLAKFYAFNKERLKAA